MNSRQQTSVSKFNKKTKRIKKKPICIVIKFHRLNKKLFRFLKIKIIKSNYYTLKCKQNDEINRRPKTLYIYLNIYKK